MILADAIKRWHLHQASPNIALQPSRVLLSTGTDEHGLKVWQAAERANIPISQFCNDNSMLFSNLAAALCISSDRFIKTTEPAHRLAVNAFWTRLLQTGDIYQGTHEGWYSVSDESFYPDSKVIDSIDPISGNHIKISAETKKPVERIAEPNYKFRLSKYTDSLQKWLWGNKDVILPRSRLTDLQEFFEQGALPDLSISRLAESVKWGIQVPNDPNHIIYVWLDALVNYLTVSGYPLENSNSTSTTSFCHVVGKDILKFHAIYWPAFLMAAGHLPPKQIIAHGHWTLQGEKMSKSVGNVIDPIDLIRIYGVDCLRYYLLKEGKVESDGDFCKEELAKIYTDDLINQLGNLVQRVSNPIFYQSDPLFLAKLQIIPIVKDAVISQIVHLFNQYRFHHGIMLIMSEMVQEANRYIMQTRPWDLAKDPQGKEELGVTMKSLLHAIRQIGILLRPIIPASAEKILNRVGKLNGTIPGNSSLHDGNGPIFPPLRPFQT